MLTYNATRIKMSLGGKSPIEYRKSIGLLPWKQSKFFVRTPTFFHLALTRLKFVNLMKNRRKY
jgi:hypothetical protein